MGDVESIKKQLSTCLDEYSAFCQNQIKHSECDSDTKHLLDELTRRTYYVFDKFEEVLLDTLS